MPVGIGNTDFTLQTGAPVESVRCLAGPTKPRPSNVQKETAWELISHLALNYLSLNDNDTEQGAAALEAGVADALDDGVQDLGFGVPTGLGRSGGRDEIEAHRTSRRASPTYHSCKSFPGS